MSMDNVTLENTQRSISSRDTKAVASVMVNGKWVNLSDTLEQANVNSSVGTVSKIVAEQQTVITDAVAQADSAVAYANDAIEKSRVNQQAIADINSAVSDAVSDAAVAKSDGLRAWNAAQSNVDLIDLNYASASAAISSARTEAIAAADEAKASASAAQADIVAVRSDVAAVQADVTANKSDVAVAKSDIAVVKTDLASQATSLSSYASQASAAGQDITVLKSQAGQFEQEMADTKGDVSQLKVSASSASAALSDVDGNISSLQASAKSFSAALSDTNSNVATVTATASELKTKYADAAGDINKLQADAKGMTQTISNAQGDIAKLKTRADGFDTEFADTNGNISKLQVDASGTKQTLANAKSDIAVLQSRADGFDAKYADAAGDINTIKVNAKGMQQTLTNAKGDISTLQATATGFKNTLTDAQGNISTLQSDVSGLKKTTSDHAGNIATLQADAKTLTSQMSGAQGDISTLKQTASGFSSKVSGMETSLANANSKIDGITSNGGGRNLLRYSTNDNGKFQPNNSKIDNYTIYFASTVYMTQGQQYIVHANASNGLAWSSTHNPSVESNNVVLWLVDNKGVNQIISDANTGTGTTFTWNHPSGTYYLRVNTYRVDNSGYADHVMLEKGIVAHDWSPAPEDTDAKITTNTTAIEQNKKAITLKADQTTVDKTNGDVKWLQSQLKVQADQINAKVSSSDLPNLVGKGGRNLWIGSKSLQNTNINVPQVDWNTDSDGINTAHITGTGGFYGKWQYIYANSTDPFTIGDSETFSVEMKGTGTITIGREHDFGKAVTLTNTWTRYSVSGTVNHANAAHIMYNNSGKDCDAYVRLPMVEKGAIAHDWQPAPEDTQTYTQTQIKQTADSWNANLTSVKNGLTQSYTNLHATVDGIQAQVYNKDGSSRITQLSNLIATKVSSSDFEKLSKNVKLQTLDSADINSMRTSGHYFVHNLANTPIQGWVYVDVVGNGNDRIRQDVYQDSGIEHKYRRWFATHWTDWEEGATESEIIQLSDDINIRVKKGNVVSQINQEAGGNTLIQVADGKGKLALNASSVVFSGSAFIPDAYITTLNADKLRFYDSSGNVATMSANLVQHDDDKVARTINLQYNGGYEVHASNTLGSILTMHDDTIRLAVKSSGSSGDQYSGVYAMTHYTQLSNYRSDGSAPGVFIYDDQFNILGDANGAGTSKGDMHISSPQLYLNGSSKLQAGGDHALLTIASDYTTIHADKNVWMETGNTQLHLDNSNNLEIFNKNNTNTSNYDVHLTVRGWATFTGWVNCLGLTQTSRLSTKTNIERLDTARALELINSADVATYQYKQDVANGGTKRHASVIIDDVNDVARYQTPDEFISEDRSGRNDGDIVGYLMGAVQELTKKFKTLESKVG